MPQIIFYVLTSTQLKNRLQLVCRLVEKAYAQQLRTYIHTDSPAMSEQLDDWLWAYNEISFLPHALFSPPASAPILIGHDPQAAAIGDYLINLTLDSPRFFPQFGRMAEVIDQNEDILRAGRKRYQFYREQGYNLEYHQLR